MTSSSPPTIQIVEDSAPWKQQQIEGVCPPTIWAGGAQRRSYPWINVVFQVPILHHIDETCARFIFPIAYAHMEREAPETVFICASLKSTTQLASLGWYFGSATVLLLRHMNKSSTKHQHPTHQVPATEPKSQTSVTSQYDNLDKFWKWRFSFQFCWPSLHV